MSNVSKKAFTLVELAMAISIMAILSVTVLGVAKIKDISLTRAIFAEEQKIKKYLYDFEEIKSMLPGDFYDAKYTLSAKNYESYTLTSVTKSDFESKLSIDGNGDGKISNKLKSTLISGGTIYYSESLQVWNHLFRSGIIDESYSGVCYSNTSLECAKVGYNIMKSKNFTENMGYNIIFPSEKADDNFIDYSTEYQYFLTLSNFKDHNIIILSSFVEQDENARGTLGSVHSNIAEMIDNKFDDGLPMTGSILAENDNNNMCHDKAHETSGKTTSDTSYMGKNSKQSCILMFTL